MLAASLRGSSIEAGSRLIRGRATFRLPSRAPGRPVDPAAAYRLSAAGREDARGLSVPIRSRGSWNAVCERVESQVVDAGSGRVRAVHDHARQHDRHGRPADDQARARSSASRSSSGSLPPTRSLSPSFILIGGKLADMLGRRLMFNVGLGIFTVSSLVCGLAGPLGPADRRPRRAGRRGGDHDPIDALDRHGGLSSPSARDGDRRLGRNGRDGARDRSATRRHPDPAAELALDLLRQRPRGRDRDGRLAHRHRRVARHIARAEP